jgi:Tryptophan halogenase
MALDQSALLKHVQQHTVRDPPWDLRLHGCSARSSIRRLLWRESYLAIGDAACFIDPLSGTGIERAIEDGISAADALSTALTGGGPEQLRANAMRRARAFQDGLDLQRRYYGAVGRWADAPFWSRRLRPVTEFGAGGAPPEPGLPLLSAASRGLVYLLIFHPYGTMTLARAGLPSMEVGRARGRALVVRGAPRRTLPPAGRRLRAGRRPSAAAGLDPGPG